MTDTAKEQRERKWSALEISLHEGQALLLSAAERVENARLNYEDALKGLAEATKRLREVQQEIAQEASPAQTMMEWGAEMNNAQADYLEREARKMDKD